MLPLSGSRTMRGLVAAMTSRIRAGSVFDRCAMQVIASRPSLYGLGSSSENMAAANAASRSSGVVDGGNGSQSR
jgi:hypothetical protein